MPIKILACSCAGMKNRRAVFMDYVEITDEEELRDGEWRSIPIERWKIKLPANLCPTCGTPLVTIDEGEQALL